MSDKTSYNVLQNFSEGKNNKLYVLSSQLSIADAINTAAVYKQLIKDQ